MKNLIIISCMAVLILFFLTGSVFAEDKPTAADVKAKAVALHPQTNCPVQGGKIDKEVYLDYEGQRVYFCCPGCEKKFLADPNSFLKKMKAEGVELEKVKK